MECFALYFVGQKLFTSTLVLMVNHACLFLLFGFFHINNRSENLRTFLVPGKEQDINTVVIIIIIKISNNTKKITAKAQQYLFAVQ